MGLFDEQIIQRKLSDQEILEESLFHITASVLGRRQAGKLDDERISAKAAIDEILNPPEHTFDVYSINSTSEGKDTLGDVSIKLSSGYRTYVGRGLSTDIIEASITAYIQASNKMLAAGGKL